MKNTWKLAFAAFTMFAFTACSSGEDNMTTESENIETTDQIEADMETDLDTDMDATDETTVLEDTTVDDGVADEIQEETPPVE